jgi:hypothetical protein
MKLTLVAEAGEGVSAACAAAVRIAHILQVCVDFKFCGTSVYADPSDSADEVQKRYWTSREREWGWLRRKIPSEKSV